ncbi:MAG: hypothetical protein GY950_28040 [bacterium]|nr:hypothetical protein [bacterium]
MKKIPYQNFSSFILRTPLLSFNFLETLISGTQTSEEQLMEVCRLPVVDEAIFLASPDLHSQMKHWLKGELSDRKKRERLHYGLMRYILRMSTRPTPFGLFAGFSIGQWGEEGRVELPEQSDYERHTRLDMNYLCALAQELAKNPVIKENILHYPNSSIYPVGDQLRYVEYRYHNARRTHHIVAVDHSEYLQQVLEKAAAGAYIKNLAQLLVDDEITIEDARDFIGELVNSQVLVNQLEPAITGPEFLDQIMAVLEPLKGIDNIKKIILETKGALEQIDNSRIGTTVANYHQIAEHLKPLETDFELKFLFQTDMVKPTLHCTVEWNLAEDLLKGFDVMNKLTMKTGTTTLTQFKDAFFERYETRELPLIQALDTESGIGYRQTGSSGDIGPLVDDLALPGGGGDAGSDLKWTPVQSFLFKKYKEALTGEKFEIELTDKELEPFNSDWSDLPDSFSAMVQIVEDANESNPRKKVLVSGFGGSSSGNLLGRFCHADAPTDTFVKEITRVEKELNPDVILAEIIHLPESRVGNVLLRPVLRQHEIPYLAKAAVPVEDQIKVQDLMVSVQRNRVVLRDKRLNKEVIPRLTNAHNYSFNALPVYHFLADFQTQNLRGGVGFNWGALAGEYEFLPRVVYRNLVFSPATWNIKKEDIEKLVKIKDDHQLVQACKEWREKKKIPGQVMLADSDNKLYINLDNALCIRTLFSVTKNRGGFQLVEFLFDPGNAVVKSKEGVYPNEFIFSFHKVKEEVEKA